MFCGRQGIITLNIKLPLQKISIVDNNKFERFIRGKVFKLKLEFDMFG